MENGSKMRLTIITGMSGAGKTVAVQCLEDMGYFCIDNLPPMLLLKFIEMIDQSPVSYTHLTLPTIYSV